MQTQYVFVYGSLKAGSWNHRVLGDSEFVGEAHTLEEFVLVDCGFPYLIVPESLSKGRTMPKPVPVVGEVYKVIDKAVMASLDALEGVAYNHYKHLTTDVMMGNNEVLSVTCYVACDPDEKLSLTVCPINKEGCYEW